MKLTEQRFFQRRVRNRHELKIVSAMKPRRNESNHVLVPGAEARGLVAPIMERAVETASSPSHTIAHTGPEEMKSTRAE